MHHGWDIDLRWKQAIPHAQKKARKLRSWVRAHDKMSKRGYQYRRLTPIVGRRYPDHHVCMRAMKAGKKLPALCNTVLKRRAHKPRVRKARKSRKARQNPRAALVAAKTALEAAHQNGASEAVLRKLVAQLIKATRAFKKSQRPRRNARKNPRAALVAAKTALEAAHQNGASEAVLRKLVAKLKRATRAFKKSQRPRRNRRNGRNRRSRKVRRSHKKVLPPPPPPPCHLPNLLFSFFA
jgi:hypothetical protein